MKTKRKIFICILALFLIITTIFMLSNNDVGDAILTSTNLELSNTKIEWGIKREKNHKQPDLGRVNLELINKYEGIAMGNSESKNIYLTFDMGYEAGYTEKILDVLKENNVSATFFITAHYLNTREDLVKRMIDEGHIVGNHNPVTLMY